MKEVSSSYDDRLKARMVCVPSFVPSFGPHVGRRNKGGKSVESDVNMARR